MPDSGPKNRSHLRLIPKPPDEASRRPYLEFANKLPEDLYASALHYATSITGGDEDRAAELLACVLTELLVDEETLTREIDRITNIVNLRVHLIGHPLKDEKGDIIRYISSEEPFDPNATEALDQITKELDELANSFWNRA